MQSVVKMKTLYLVNNPLVGTVIRDLQFEHMKVGIHLGQSIEIVSF